MGSDPHGLFGLDDVLNAQIRLDPKMDPKERLKTNRNNYFIIFSTYKNELQEILQLWYDHPGRITQDYHTQVRNFFMAKGFSKLMSTDLSSMIDEAFYFWFINRIMK